MAFPSGLLTLLSCFIHHLLSRLLDFFFTIHLFYLFYCWTIPAEISDLTSYLSKISEIVRT